MITNSTVMPDSGRLRTELLPFTLPGVLCIVAGGLLAAVTASAPTQPTTWATAYLVLVGGVAQAGLGAGQILSTRYTPRLVIAAQVVGWNLGNAAVLVGALSNRTGLVDIGGALLVVVLILLTRALVTAGTRPVTGLWRWLRYGYGLLIILLIVSIPVGLVLARWRP